MRNSVHTKLIRLQNCFPLSNSACPTLEDFYDITFPHRKHDTATPATLPRDLQVERGWYRRSAMKMEAACSCGTFITTGQMTQSHKP